MRFIIPLILFFVPHLVHAQDWEDRKLFEGADAGTTLTIVSSTDTSFFAPVIESFLAGQPNLSVEYLVAGTADIDRLVREDPEAYDLVISSAMDLQYKLANDGFAMRLGNVTHPAFAHWRHSLFGFTSEPAAIVLNRAAFSDQPIPQTRQELIQALRANPDKFRDKVGTYDVRRSGLGYLFATQDARASETFWRLMEVIGGLNVRLYCCSGEMIDDLASGEIFVAYNVLGSYAAAREDSLDALEIVLPSDFPTTMMRTAMVLETTKYPNDAASFVRHLIALQTSDDDILTLPKLTSNETAEQTTIALEPALMTYLDKLKRRTFLEEWGNAIIQGQ